MSGTDNDYVIEAVSSDEAKPPNEMSTLDWATWWRLVLEGSKIKSLQWELDEQGRPTRISGFELSTGSIIIVDKKGYLTTVDDGPFEYPSLGGKGG